MFAPSAPTENSAKELESWHHQPLLKIPQRSRKVFTHTENFAKEQGWEFAHSLIAHSLIHSFAHLLIAHLLICSFAHFAQIKCATVSDSHRSLKTNERPWANPSGHSEEMSDRERMAQVAQEKWATMSDLLRSLRGNEQCERIAHFAHQTWANEWIAHFF